LIICGPILRRVEPTAVSVWVALSAPDVVTLTVQNDAAVVATSAPTAAIPLGQAPVMDSTLMVGHLFVALVTAAPPSASPFAPEKTYTYDLAFTTKPSFAAALGESTLSAISYLPSSSAPQPSFSLPPQTLSEVNIAHASCRKARGESVDAFPVLDSVMTKAGNVASGFASNRIHQLILTGDQLYCDDIAPQFLAMCIDAAGWLMGDKKEKRPANIGPLAQTYTVGSTVTSWRTLDWDTHGWSSGYTETFPWDIDDPWPGVGARGPHMFGAGFTVTAPEREMSDPLSKPIAMAGPPPGPGDGTVKAADYSAAANHLMLLGEFYSCYLLSWSPALWPPAVTASDLPFSELTDNWDKANADRLASFGRGLQAVRRVLANVPTYMILDDHDVTDDWFMNREWCNRVLSQQGDTLGRRVIRNALIAYAVFQAWGNTPDQFAGQQPGARLLAKLAAGDELGSDLGATPSSPTAADLVGVPDPLAAVAQGASTSALSRPSGSLTWSYQWRPSGWPYELIVLDCRTVRAYLPDPLNSPLLLDDGDSGTRDDQTVQQIPGPDVTPGTPFVTLVVIQTPLLGMLIVDKLASLGSSAHPVFDNDAEAWSMSDRAQQAVLARLVEHNPLTVVLSGDVHYSFGMTADYWAQQPWRTTTALSSPRTGRVVQLVSSAARNEIRKTRFAHVVGPVMGRIGSQTILGWNSNPVLAVATLKAALRELDIDTTRLPSLSSAPYLINAEIGTGPFGARSAEWKYRLRPVGASGVVGPVTAPVQTMPQDASGLVTAVAGIQKSLSDIALTLSAQVVGNNNVCVVNFTGTGPADWSVTQTMYTRPADTTGQSTDPAATTVIGAALQYVPDTQW
jgi:hypothetical protein